MQSTSPSSDNDIMDMLQQVWVQHQDASTTTVQETATLPQQNLPFDFSPQSLVETPSILLVLAVIVEMIVPYFKKAKISGLEPLFTRLGYKVNRPKDGVSQHVFAGVMLPTLILCVIFIPFLLIEYLTQADGVISLVLLCILLELKYPQNCATEVYNALSHGDKSLARLKLSQTCLREVINLSEMGIAKASAESVILRVVSGYLALMFWFAVSGIEAALLMQLVNVMNRAFNAKLPQNQPFGRALFVLQQFMLLPVSIVLMFLLLFSSNPLRHLATGWEGLQSYPAPITGLILGAVGGALNLSLGGPRYYRGHMVRLPRIGGTGVANAESILYAMRKIRMCSLIFLVIVVFLDINFL